MPQKVKNSDMCETSVIDSLFFRLGRASSAVGPRTDYRCRNRCGCADSRSARRSNGDEKGETALDRGTISFSLGRGHVACGSFLAVYGSLVNQQSRRCLTISTLSLRTNDLKRTRKRLRACDCEMVPVKCAVHSHCSVSTYYTTSSFVRFHM